MFATIATIVIATNIYAQIQEDFKYYSCDGEVTNPNFNVTLNRDNL